MKKRQNRNLLAAGTALLVAEPVLAMAHAGGVGVIVGAMASVAAYVAMDDYQQAAGTDEGNEYEEDEEEETASPSLAYRLLKGKSVRGEGQGEREPAPHKKRVRRSIVLSPDLVLDRDEIICKAIFAVGQRRSGKTTLAALLAEQMGAYHVPLFIPDSEGDLLSVYELLPRGVIAAAPGSPWEENEEVNLWVVTTDDADVLGFQILYEGMQVIFDMSSFEDENEAWQVVAGVIKGLFDFANQYPEMRCPVEVFLDEAQKYLPQDMSTSAISDAETRNHVLSAYKNLSGTGGKRGLTPVIFSQRFAETNNQIIAQSELRFILRQTQDNDLERCKKYVKAETATPQEIANLSKGQGVFVGEDGTQLVTTFYPRRSDSRRSSTPTASAVERFANAPLTLQHAQPHRRMPEEKSRPAIQPQPLKLMHRRRATLTDAIAVWNASDERIGRPRLMKELKAKGLECSDYLAAELLSQILEREQSDAVVGGGDDE